MYEEYFEANREAMIADLKSLVQINSVKGEAREGAPFGEGVRKALDAALGLSSKLGLNGWDLDGYMGLVDYGEGEQMLGIMAHLDVVPEGTGWEHAPFGGEISDGRMYGRGTVDNKGAVISMLYALKAVKESGRPLHHRVRLMLGCDEESGWGCMSYYKSHERMPDLAFSPDGEYPVINAEKGVLHLGLTRSFASAKDEGKLTILTMKGGNRVNMVPDYAVAEVRLPLDGSLDAKGLSEQLGEGFTITPVNEYVAKIEKRGISAHGSTPELGENAVAGLAHALYHLGLQPGGATNLLTFVGRNLTGDTGGKSLGLDLRDAVSGALTLNLGVFELNAEGVSMMVDIRYPISVNRDELLEKIGKAMELPGLTVTVNHSLDAHYVDEQSELVQKLLQVYASETGNAPQCRSIGGATYARAMDYAVTFGPSMPGDPHIAHQSDEYVELERIEQNARIIAAAITALCID